MFFLSYIVHNTMKRPSDARKRLIEAAKEVIYAHSYEAVTVDELCTAQHKARLKYPGEPG